MNDNSNESAVAWYVMRHPNPRQIEALLKKECAGRFCEESSPPQPFKFYIPYLYIPVSDGSDYTNALRSDFHGFVFIQATGSRVDKIVTSDWNTKGSLRLHYYRDHEGKNVVVSDAEVQNLMSTFKDQTLKFFIGHPIDEFSPGDKVILNIESWAGQKGAINDIRLRKGKLTMTISVNIFNQTKSINFTNLRTGDITFEDPAKEALFSSTPIDHFEEETIDILSHRFSPTTSKETVQADTARLKRLATFDRLYMEEDDADYPRFLSLKLICATLRQSRKKETLQKEVEKHLAGKDSPTSANEAYLMTALFIATRQARYRDAVKSYRNAHPDSPDILRRYHTIVKKMKAKSTNKKD